MTDLQQFTVVVPAAGVGKRMQADRPKQYLSLLGKTLLEHTLERLISHPQIGHIVVALSADDPYFSHLPVSQAPWLTRVNGGKERADSVLAGLEVLSQQEWVLVHDAARPCLPHQDLDKLLSLAQTGNTGGILATPVRDTMKRQRQDRADIISHTEPREGLWHALTPQFFPLQHLRDSLAAALRNQIPITDEASAIEWADGSVRLIEGSDCNIKVTRPEDLALAEFYLRRQSGQMN